MASVTVINTILLLNTQTYTHAYVQSYVINITFLLAKPVAAAYYYDEDNYYYSYNSSSNSTSNNNLYTVTTTTVTITVITT